MSVMISEYEYQCRRDMSTKRWMDQRPAPEVYEELPPLETLPKGGQDGEEAPVLQHR